MKKIQLINEEVCRKDLSEDFDVINTVDEIKERLAEFPINEYSEGDSFYIKYCNDWPVYTPAGVFRFIRFDNEMLEMVFEYVDLYYSLTDSKE
ncbi:TPA_asm: hypothetical protein GF125_01755 [Listeria monocytogenes]|nr:hypothetical protein [Listeria monocytogenes]